MHTGLNLLHVVRLDISVLRWSQVPLRPQSHLGRLADASISVSRVLVLVSSN